MDGYKILTLQRVLNVIKVHFRGLLKYKSVSLGGIEAKMKITRVDQ